MAVTLSGQMHNSHVPKLGLQKTESDGFDGAAKPIQELFEGKTVQNAHRHAYDATTGRRTWCLPLETVLKRA